MITDSPSREMPASQKTALEAVMEADQERIKLEKLAEELALIEEDDAQDYLMEVSSIFVSNFPPVLKLLLIFQSLQRSA